MFMKHGPLVCNSAWGNHRVPKDIKCYFATEVVGHLHLKGEYALNHKYKSAKMFQALNQVTRKFKMRMDSKLSLNKETSTLSNMEAFTRIMLETVKELFILQ